ncbi:ABC transporter ATP-binding protein [Candidatus Kaiserbacteria bacterium]|nr:ABC transporter ATP-binding protein [Candidatus Kaiserbacteria bacterium]
MVWDVACRETLYIISYMIEIRDLKKTFGTHMAVDGISLSIKKGSVFGILGPNGAGKTTMMKVIVGLDRPTSGSVRIDGRDPAVRQTRESIGFMPESPSFYDHLTGLEFLTFCGSLFHTQAMKHHEYLDLLKRVGIFEAKDAPICTYSKGMRQRLAFAQAIVNDPAYLFLDEPLDGLDPIGRRELKSIITALQKKGTTIVFNSHILFDTEELCDEIGILHHGSLLYSGPIEAFTKGQPLEERFVSVIQHLS